ncbi:histidine kinase [Streptomyces sp. NPDC004658]|uniref:sensor histidine kinase n=1 Tax=Streptomyces sp. NPDC004658 TaxID=3154672 RepID=UPI0033ABC33C
MIFLDVLSEHPSPHAALWCGVALPVTAVLQVWHSSPTAADRPAVHRAASLALQAIVTYLPLLAVKREWGGMAGFLAGSVLLLVPRVLSWVLYTGVVLSIVVSGAALGADMLDIVYLSISTAVIGLIVYGLSRLSGLVAELIAAREDLAQLAVVRERMRFASDMHDLLGFKLSTITLKAELANRLVDSRPDDAHTEISEILDICRQALADVRQVAHGHRRLSLAVEAQQVRTALSAARIRTDIDFRHGPLSAEADTVLAIVVREAATNVLRHSKATRCRITTEVIGNVKGRVRLSVRNDGAVARLPQSRGIGGTGLASLTDRLSALHGTLTACVTGGNEFELVVEVPSRATQRAVRPWTPASQGSTVA